MGLFYEHEPPPPEDQHERLVALRELISHGIPCILWAEDALNYVHNVPTFLFDQQILVPDELPQSASSVLCKGPYSKIPFTNEYADCLYQSEAESGFPQGILHHRELPDDGEPAYELLQRPGYILLLPASYFGFDVRSKERFQTLVPPLPPSNADILVPRYHTFLEGLVAFNAHPPFPFETPHAKQRTRHDIYIAYLLRYRVKYKDGLFDPPIEEVLPEDRVILSELQTEEARWYVGMFINDKRFPSFQELKDHHLRSASELNPSSVETSTVGSPQPCVPDPAVIETSHDGPPGLPGGNM